MVLPQWRKKIDSNTPRFFDLDAEVSSAHKMIGATTVGRPCEAAL
jgi:hypothetical protein